MNGQLWLRLYFSANYCPCKKKKKKAKKENLPSCVKQDDQLRGNADDTNMHLLCTAVLVDAEPQEGI